MGSSCLTIENRETLSLNWFSLTAREIYLYCENKINTLKKIKFKPNSILYSIV